MVRVGQTIFMFATPYSTRSSSSCVPGDSICMFASTWTGQGAPNPFHRLPRGSFLSLPPHPPGRMKLKRCVVYKYVFIVEHRLSSKSLRSSFGGCIVMLKKTLISMISNGCGEVWLVYHAFNWPHVLGGWGGQHYRNNHHLPTTIYVSSHGSGPTVVVVVVFGAENESRLGASRPIRLALGMVRSDEALIAIDRAGHPG